MRKIMLALTAIGLIAGISANAADTNKKAEKAPTLKESVAKVRKECRSDVNKFCKQVPEGEGRVMSCLWEKRVNVTDSCKQAIAQADAAASRAVDKADVQFRKDCGSDVQKFCADVPSGRGRLLDCLSENEADLSKSCRSFQAKLQNKVEEFTSAGA